MNTEMNVCGLHTHTHTHTEDKAATQQRLNTLSLFQGVRLLAQTDAWSLVGQAIQKISAKDKAEVMRETSLNTQWK
jgi:ribosome biogenesis protein Tsr3